MLEKNRRTYATASTGMAHLQFSNAKTLHSWSGYGDGSVDTERLIKRITINPAYEDVKKNIIECDSLIIDEIGMISSKMFASVEKICRSVRNSTTIFGGIQVIAGGSFVQLPPVPSALDPGNYCFLADHFWKTFAHTMRLTEVVRQHEHDLKKAVNELCEGCPSKETLELVTSLNRPLPNYDDAVFIFGTNFDVNFYNHVKVDSLPGFQFICYSEDSGEHMLLKRLAPPKYLCLKPFCKLIVVRNLQNGLVNGMSCTLQGIDDDELDVRVEDDKHLHHKMGGQRFKLQRQKFNVRDDAGVIVASRYQFPVKLGYCITVDKAQGRTIDKVVVDGSNIWRPGQLGVAIGRAVSTAGLQVINFNKQSANLKHPDSVYEAYNRKMETIKGDRSCCTKKVTGINVHTFAIHHYQQQVQQLYAANEEDDSTSEALSDIELPWKMNDFIQENLTLGKTSTQKKRNQLLADNCDKQGFIEFVKTMYNTLSSMFATYRTSPKGSKCNWCQLVDTLNMHLQSPSYLASVKTAFNVQECENVHFRLAATICYTILNKVVNAAKQTELDNIKPLYSGPEDRRLTLSLDELNTLRYVSGACIHHLNKRLQNNIDIDLMGNLYKARKKYRCSQLLSYLCNTQVDLEKMSQNPETLIETIRRQGNKQGLKFVTDEVSCIQNLVTFESRLSGLYTRNVATIHNDVDLMNNWFNLFSKCQDKCYYSPLTCSDQSNIEQNTSDWQFELESTLIMDMYDEVTRYYIKVHLNELRKKYLDSKSLAPKAMQHRHEILVASKHKSKANAPEYPCGKCAKECIDIATCKKTKFEDFSVQCDKCTQWYHYICVNLTGKETFLKESSNDAYICPTCYNLQTVEHVEQVQVVETNECESDTNVPLASESVQSDQMIHMASQELDKVAKRKRSKSRVTPGIHVSDAESSGQSRNKDSSSGQASNLSVDNVKQSRKSKCKNSATSRPNESSEGKKDTSAVVTHSGRAVKKKVIHDA